MGGIRLQFESRYRCQTIVAQATLAPIVRVLCKSAYIRSNYALVPLSRIAMVVFLVTFLADTPAFADSVELPFPSFGLSSASITKSVTYTLDKPCAGGAIYSRKVIAYLPPDAQFFKQENINRFYFAAMDAVEKLCPANNGLTVNTSVTFMQDNKSIFDIYSSAYRGDGYRHFIENWNNLADQREQEDKAKQASIKRWNNFYSTIHSIFYILIACIVAIPTFRYGPKALAYLSYMFSPHPANKIITRATQRDNSIAVSGSELASALRNVPKSITGKILATRDLNEMSVRTDQETAYLRAAENLARKTFEMEEARAIADQLKKSRGES